MLKELQLSNEQEARAMSLHKKAIVADMSLTGSSAHPVLPRNGKTYYERMTAAGLTIASHTLGHAEPDFHNGLEDANIHNRLVAQNPDKYMLVTRSEHFRQAKEEGKIGLVLTFQNATQLEDDWLNYLPVFHALGVRVIGPTYNTTNLLGSGCLEPVDNGLTGYGRQVIRAMGHIGMLVDLSHTGDRTCRETLEVAQDPVLLTHANPRALNASPRNKPDDILKAVAASGGVVGVVAWNVLCMTKPNVQPTILDLADHIDYLVNLIGVDHVGLGSDMNENFDALPVKSNFAEVYGWMMEGVRNMTEPVGFGSVDDYPNLTRVLVKRGYSDSDILKILGENYMRVAKQVWDR